MAQDWWSSWKSVIPALQVPIKLRSKVSACFQERSEANAKGVSGFIHLAVDLSFAFSAIPNPKASIASATDMTLGILKSALEVPSMRAAVVCSSIAAMYHPQAGKPVHPSITEYNDIAIELAHSLPDDDPFKGAATYMASKTEAERGWSWVSEMKVGPRHVAPRV